TLQYEKLPAPDPAQAGYFAGVTMTADDGATFQVSRVGGAFAATQLSVGDQQFERVVPLKDETLTQWLGHELSRLSPTPTYNAAIFQLVEAARSAEATTA